MESCHPGSAGWHGREHISVLAARHVLQDDLSLQEMHKTLEFLLHDIELLDPEHTIADSKLWNHVILEV